MPELAPARVFAGTIGLPTVGDALRLIHRPPPGVDTTALSDGAHPAQLRLAFEELLAHHLAVRRRRQYRESSVAPSDFHRHTSLATVGETLGIFPNERTAKDDSRSADRFESAPTLLYD